MLKTLFDRLLIGDIVYRDKKKQLFTVAGSFAEGQKIEIVRYERVTSSTVKEWHRIDNTPLEDMQDLRQGMAIIHVQSGLKYFIGIVDGNYAYGVCMQIVRDTQASDWHLHAKSSGVRPA